MDILNDGNGIPLYVAKLLNNVAQIRFALVVADSVGIDSGTTTSDSGGSIFFASRATDWIGFGFIALTSGWASGMGMVFFARGMMSSLDTAPERFQRFH